MKSFFHFLIYSAATLFLLSTSLKMPLIGAIILSLVIIGYSMYRLNKNKYDSAAVMSVGMMTNAMFYFLGVYLGTYFKPFATIITIGGMLLSLVVMFFYFFWKEGKKRVEFVVKQERFDSNKKPSIRERWTNIKGSISIMKSIHRRAKELQESEGLGKWFSYQMSFVEHERKANWKAPINAIDFPILREVEMNRNEYSIDDGKRRSN